MNSFKDRKIHSSVWTKKSYSSVLRSPSLPVPGQRGPVRCFPKSQAWPAPSKSMPSKYGQHGNYWANYRGNLGNSNWRSGRSEAPTAPADPDNVPFFASNLRYYPHLPQPVWVSHYQTYSEIKELMSKGDHSKFGPPKSAEVRGQYGQQHGQQHGQQYGSGRFISRSGSDVPPKPAPNRRHSTARDESNEPPIRRFQKTPGGGPPNAAFSRGFPKSYLEVHDEPAGQAPNRRYSMTRKNGNGNNGKAALTNLIFSASSKPHKQLKQPVQDPLLTQFKARQDELQRGAGGDLSNKPRRLQPSWCPSHVDSKDAPLSWSWRSNTQQPFKKSAPK